MMDTTLEGSKRTRLSAEDARTHLIGDVDEDCLITKFTEFYLFLARRPWPVGIGGGLVVLAYMPLLLLVYPPAAFMVWSITLNIHRRNCVIAYSIAQKAALRDANPPMVEAATVINDVAAQPDADSEVDVVVDQCGTMVLVPPNHEDWIAHLGTIVDRLPDVEVTPPVPRPDPPSGEIRRLPPPGRSGVSEPRVLVTGESASVDGVSSNPPSHSSMPPLTDEVVSTIYVVVGLDGNCQIHPRLIIGPNRPPNVAVELPANDTSSATSVSSSLVSDLPMRTTCGDDEMLTVPNHSMVTKLQLDDEMVSECNGEDMGGGWNKVPTGKAISSAKPLHMPSVVDVAPAAKNAVVEQAQKPPPEDDLIGAKTDLDLATSVASSSSRRVTADRTMETKLKAAAAVRQYTNRKIRKNQKKMEQREKKGRNDANHYAPLVTAWNNTPEPTDELDDMLSPCHAGLDTQGSKCDSVCDDKKMKAKPEPIDIKAPHMEVAWPKAAVDIPLENNAGLPASTAVGTRLPPPPIGRVPNLESSVVHTPNPDEDGAIDLTSQSSCGVAYSGSPIAWEENGDETWETTAPADLPNVGAVADDEEIDQTLVERMRRDARCVTVVLDGYEISNKEWDFINDTRDIYKQPLLSDDPHLTFGEQHTLMKYRKPILRHASKPAVGEHWEEFLNFLGMPSRAVYYKYARHFKSRDAMKRKVPIIEDWYNYYKAGGIDQVKTYAIKNWCPHKWTVDKRDVNRRVQYQKNNKFID